MTRTTGLAGRLAAAFIHSKLTPLLVVTAVLLGAAAIVALPREEEPQIIVPMIDVFVDLPGATPAEIEQRVTRPIERRLWEIPGVEYLYSTSSQGRSMVIARFLVGEDVERALVRLNQKLDSAKGELPPGATTPLVQARSIDDVPVMALTLWGEAYDAASLRLMAAELRDVLKQVTDISEVTLIGGQPRRVTVELDPAALEARGLDPLMVGQALARANVRQPAGAVVSAGRAVQIDAGTWPGTAAELERIVVGTSAGAAVYLSDVARVIDGGGEPDTYVAFHPDANRTRPAVTLAIAKRKGTNAIELTRRIEEKITTARGQLLPGDLEITVTRNYGETAQHKSNELLFHMFLAVLSVSILIWLALGRRESIIVLTAIPVTLALTLFVFYLYGYTLNRITLFALIFSIGILVDDAIVVVENIARHARMTPDRSRFEAIAIRAVDEVGNPTILATLTVVAAILPMAFVGGLMGPYMRPIPVGASAAMLFSLAVAFIVTPWAAVRLLGRGAGHHDEREDRLTAVYRRVMGRLIDVPRARWTFLGVVALLLVASMALVPLGLVAVKMLPFDNKSELQVVVRLPDEAPVEATARVVSALAGEALKDPVVVAAQSYAGAASPYTFNGLVRHYFLREQPSHGDLQIQLRPKEERSEQSHDVAKRLRERLLPVARALGASIQVVEVPPGPPVLQTLVAEVYGPDRDERMRLASGVKSVFESTPGVVDVDWYVETERPRWRLEVDADKAAAAGVSAAEVAAVVRMAGDGTTVGLLHDPRAREDVPVVLRLPREARGSADRIQSVRIGGRDKAAVGALTRAVPAMDEPSIHRKNL